MIRAVPCDDTRTYAYRGPYHRRHLVPLQPRLRECVCLSASCVQRVQDPAPNEGCTSWNPARQLEDDQNKRLFGRMEEGQGGRKETKNMNGTFLPESGALVSILRPRFLLSFVLARGASSSVVSGSARRQLDVPRRIFCASSNTTLNAPRCEPITFFDISSRRSGMRFYSWKSARRARSVARFFKCRSY